MTNPITIFSGTDGLNTKIDPARLGTKNNVLDLAVAADVDVTDTGRISRRKGYTKQVSTAAHSLFCEGGDCLFVSGASLCALNPDYTHVVVTSVTADLRVSYTQVNGQIYFCNGKEKGIVRNGQYAAWEKGTYVGPDTHRQLVGPPTGTIVEYYRNRMYVVQKNVLWYSEPGAYGAFDLVRGFILYPSDIRMVVAVDDGIYVSDSTSLYFLAGKAPTEFEQILLVQYPAIQWTESKFNGQLHVDQYRGPTIRDGQGKAAMWLSKEGVCYGGPGGFHNLSQDKIADFPSGLTGSGLVYNGKYVGLIDP